MKTKNSHFTIWLAFAILLCFFISYVVSLMHCNLRKSIPNVPIYPDADLVRQSDDSFASNYGLATYKYTTPDSPSSIIRYYEKQGAECDEFDINPKGRRFRLCSGKANPFGEYVLIVEWPMEDTNMITYTVEITWRKCGTDF